MKSKLLFLAMVLVGLTSATATTAGDAVLNGEDLKTNRFGFTQPISFVERGVEFLIFPDGSFDFNTEVFTTNPGNDDFYYRRNRRSTNRTYGAPNTSQYHTRGVIVTHDRLGRVRRIGNVFISYDRQGRIKRAGTVYMTYRRGQLKQVGGLQIIYNRHGIVTGTRGFVNHNNIRNSAYYSDDLYPNTYGYDWDDNWNGNDYYYYRKNGKVKKQKKIKTK